MHPLDPGPTPEEVALDLSPLEPEESPFPVAQRRILRYFDGKKVAHADPMAIEMRLIRAARNHNREYSMVLKDIFDASEAFRKASVGEDGIDPEAATLRFFDAWEEAAPIVHAAFSTRPLDPDTGFGLTLDDVIRNLTTFVNFQSAVKGGGDGLPATSPTSGSTPAGTAPGPPDAP